jgi:uracil-DNA glycosylase
MNKYEEFKTACLQCRLCHDAGLLYSEAYPLFMKHAPVNTVILFVLEAPNWNDTFTPSKRYLTVDPHTDQSGISLWDLFTNEVNLDPEKYLFLTNSVLCLPKESLSQDDVYPVTVRQRINCSRWLKMLIDDYQPKIVCAVGGIALDATARIYKHPYDRLMDCVGKQIPWYGRILYPLYHISRKTRNSYTGRSEHLQRADWRKLRQLYEAMLA